MHSRALYVYERWIGRYVIPLICRSFLFVGSSGAGPGCSLEPGPALRRHSRTQDRGQTNTNFDQHLKLDFLKGLFSPFLLPNFLDLGSYLHVRHRCLRPLLHLGVVVEVTTRGEALRRFARQGDEHWDELLVFNLSRSIQRRAGHEFGDQVFGELESGT